MKELLRNLKIMAGLFMLISALLLGGLVIQQDRSRNELAAIAGENKAALAELYGKNAGAIYSKDGRALAISQDGWRQYPAWPDSQAYVHIIGDYTHHLTNTIEARYENRLMGQERNLVDQMILDASGRGLQGDDIRVTLHDGISQAVSQALGYYDGAAVVLNWRTGEVLASVSKPTVTYPDLVAYNEANFVDTSLFNRALQGAYMPASNFKIFTTAAWLNSPNYDPNFSVNCTGEPLIANGAQDYGHGHVNLTSAFVNSCNVFFGELGRKIGRTEFLNYLDTIGFDDNFSMERIKVRSQVADVPDNDEAILSWFSVGQPVGDIRQQVNPLTLASFAGAIANEGTMMKPQIISAFVDPLGRESNTLTPAEHSRPFSPQVAATLHDLMFQTAQNNGVGVEGMSIGLKTGTGEVEGQSEYVSLITSCSKNPDYPYAVSVILDNASGGYSAVASIVQQIYLSLAYLQP